MASPKQDSQRLKDIVRENMGTEKEFKDVPKLDALMEKLSAAGLPVPLSRPYRQELAFFDWEDLRSALRTPPEELDEWLSLKLSGVRQALARHLRPR